MGEINPSRPTGQHYIGNSINAQEHARPAKGPTELTSSKAAEVFKENILHKVEGQPAGKLLLVRGQLHAIEATREDKENRNKPIYQDQKAKDLEEARDISASESQEMSSGSSHFDPGPNYAKLREENKIVFGEPSGKELPVNQNINALQVSPNEQQAIKGLSLYLSDHLNLYHQLVDKGSSFQNLQNHLMEKARNISTLEIIEGKVQLRRFDERAYEMFVSQVETNKFIYLEERDGILHGKMTKEYMEEKGFKPGDRISCKDEGGTEATFIVEEISSEELKLIKHIVKIYEKNVFITTFNKDELKANTDQVFDDYRKNRSRMENSNRIISIYTKNNYSTLDVKTTLMMLQRLIIRGMTERRIVEASEQKREELKKAKKEAILEKDIRNWDIKQNAIKQETLNAENLETKTQNDQQQLQDKSSSSNSNINKTRSKRDK